MFSNFIKTSVIAAALALGGAAVAGNNDVGNTQAQPTQQQQGMSDQQGVQGSQASMQSLKSVRLASLDQQQIKDVQTQLRDLGFYKANIDGVLGSRTRGALQAYFQQQLSLVGQGRIADQALTGFGFAKTDIEKVRGVDESNGNNVRQNTNGQETPSTSPSTDKINNNNSGNMNQTTPSNGTQRQQPVQPQQQNQPQQP
ncbi:MAG TPA: peptidoglycan-binding domain-containing protein [Polyangiaceae bacterium]|jgi:hypothetical protein